MADQAPWSGSFTVDDQDEDEIALRQVNRKTFRLECTVRYIGKETGLEGRVIPKESLKQIRFVSPAELPTTDLTSVPGPFRWFVGRYGAHTPAALIHDWLIGADPPVKGMKDEYSDRYFRFMLKDIGVRWLRRWIMWAAVAMRTRFGAGGMKRISLIVWALAALAGTVLFFVGLFDANWGLVAITALAPVFAAGLWVRQYGAGIIAAYSAPWIVPPALLAAVAYGVYVVIERGASVLLGAESAGTDTYRYQGH